MTTIEPPAETWDLESLHPHPETERFRASLEEFHGELRELASRSDTLPAVATDAATVGEWVRLLADYDRVDARHSELESFVACHAAADAQNKELHRYEARIAGLGPLRERIVTNIEFALQEAGEAVLAAFVASDKQLQKVAFFLEDCRRNAAMRLPKEQELLAADLAVDGIHAWGRLYDRISGELEIEVMERGEVVRKSPGQVTFDSPERSVRENNFRAAERAWATIGDTCADALNHICGTRLTTYARLGLRDHLESPLRHNRMRRETLEAMWGAVSDRKSMLLPYLEAKAKRFGLERLSWFDVHAPVPTTGAPRPKLAYDVACATVVDTFTGFSPEFGEFAERAIAGRWIEAENRPGKRQGGFCTDFPASKETRIFMTFSGTSDGMSTLAHELGHAYHSWVLRDQPVVLRDYPMNLAETASTFAETVLGDQRMAAASSDDERTEILDTMLSDAVAMLMNIHARYVFEDRFHTERRDGEVSAGRLSELMVEAQKETYLGVLADDGWNPGFWISKLHFYISSYPFYNFPYTFGYLLSLGISSLAAEGVDDFPERYRAMLIATGCKLTEDAVESTFGCDLTRPDFWHRGLDVIEKRVGEFV